MRLHSVSDYAGVGRFLDVCYLQSVVTTHTKMIEPTLHYMTLLAHAAVHNQKEMVKYLLEKGARKR